MATSLETKPIEATPASVKLSPLVPNPRFAQLASDAAIERAVAALEEHGMHTLVVDDGTAAKRIVLELVPPGSHVYTTGSRTLDVTGIAPELNDSGKYHSIRKIVFGMNRDTDMKEMRKLQTTHDFVVGSVHAVTETGEVLIASYGGSQLPSYAYGGDKVIWVVGTQKIVKNLDEGFQRIREYSYPLEDERLRQLMGRPSGIGKILLVEKEVFPGRITIILVKENLGF